MAYCAAYTITKDAKYSAIVEDILRYVARDLTHGSGGFYAAEDADSLPQAESAEKKEGAFCVWSWEEVEQLLGDTRLEGEEVTLAAVIQHEFNMEEGGNVDPAGDPHGELKGQNVLTRIPVKQPLISDSEKYFSAVEEGKAILYAEREKRPRPGLDIKILTSWNCLMISAYCRASLALDSPAHLASALRAGKMLRDSLWCAADRRLVRSLYGGEQLRQLDHPIPGFIDDYCYAVQACLDLYTASLEESWLELGLELQAAQDELFLCREQGGYFTSQAGDPEIVLRLKDDQDGAEPSSNSVSAMNLFRLGRILNSQQWTKQGEKIGAVANITSHSPIISVQYVFPTSLLLSTVILDTPPSLPAGGPAAAAPPRRARPGRGAAVPGPAAAAMCGGRTPRPPPRPPLRPPALPDCCRGGAAAPGRTPRPHNHQPRPGRSAPSAGGGALSCFLTGTTQGDSKQVAK